MEEDGTDESHSPVVDSQVQSSKPRPLALLCLGALGVVFGDIGTSPIYAFREAFTVLESTEENVVGVLSMILFAITLLISVKYLGFLCYVTTAGGSGGTLAITRALTHTPLRVVLPSVAVVAVALFLSDSVVTPGISVLSAVEGLVAVSPTLEPYCTPLAVVFISLLFYSQRFGSGALGRAFGPVMLVFFLSIACGGFLKLWETGQFVLLLRALNPMEAITFVWNNPHNAWLGVGSVLLAVTGCEALYSDVGIFGRTPIQLVWSTLVCVSLLLCYAGQAAIILTPDLPRELQEHPFFALATTPELRTLLVVLSTMATMIASQSVISGMFQVMEQARALGFAPKSLQILYPAGPQRHHELYIPSVNNLVWAACLMLVLAFRESSSLAHAYGLAVTGAMLIDSLMILPVFYYLWGWHPLTAFLFQIPFVALDGAFFVAGMAKFFSGAWVSALMSCVLTIWLSVMYERSRSAVN